MTGLTSLRVIATLLAALPLPILVPVAGAQGGPPEAPPPTAAPRSVPEALRAMMDAPQYRNARWGLYVADRATGAPLYDLNAGVLILPASTTKLFSTAAALDAYGADFRFETPVYRRGTVDAQGTLQGD